MITIDTGLTLLTGALNLADELFPGAAAAGFTLHEIAGLVHGVQNAVPDAVAVRDEMVAIQAGGGVATPEQRASWRARAVSIHAAIQAS